MNIYLIQISDRSYGFRVVALVAKDEEAAKILAEKKWCCYFGDWFGKNRKINHDHAEIKDSCPAEDGQFATLEHEE